MKIFRVIRRACPLTLFGSLTLAGTILLWVFSQLTENQTGMFLSVSGFILVAVSVLLTHLRFEFSNGDSISCSVIASLHAGENSSAVKINCLSWGLPFFLRSHWEFREISRAGNSRFPISRRNTAFRVWGNTSASLSLPQAGNSGLCGVFSLRDILGLFAQGNRNRNYFYPDGQFLIGGGSRYRYDKRQARATIPIP